MKRLTIFLKRLACCMSFEERPLTMELDERTSSQSLTSMSSSNPRSTTSNEIIASCTQEATPISRSATHSSSLDDANARVAACSSPSTSSTSKEILVQPQPKRLPQRTTNAIVCSLETLPVEIQTIILAESSLVSLRALIRSSPRFYYVYSNERLRILRKALNCTLDSIFSDAYAAYQSDQFLAGAIDASPFSLNDYLENLHTAPSNSATDRLSLAVAQKMAVFHLRVVEPLTERYACWALSALSSSPQETPLTKTEKFRIQRALYRLEIICNSRLSLAQTMLNVLDSFGPWEAEEIICVYEFAKERCSSVIIECARELCDEWRHIFHLDFNMKLPAYSDDYLNEQTIIDIVSQGLRIVQQTFEAENIDELSWIIRSYSKNGYLGYMDEWIDGAVQERGQPQYQRYYEAYSEHDEAQDIQQEMRFEQDDLSSPPLAWVAFWDGRYSNQIGFHIPDAMHRWGYVMWDAKRLKDSGAMGYIELEWQCKYGVRGSPYEDDPREYFISAHRDFVLYGD